MGKLVHRERERENRIVRTLLPAFQFQKDGVQGMPIRPRPARAIVHHGGLYAIRKETMRDHLETSLRGI